MLFQVLCGFEPIFYTTHPNEESKNITLFREKIYEEIWGSEYSVESRTLDLHIQRLRKKLDIGDSLKTVFKAGYRLEE